MNDERDPQLSALYRASATEVPPRRLDEAILGAARAEAFVRPPRPWWSWFPASWALPVSAAAVVVLAVSIVLVFRIEDVAEPLPQLAAPGERAAPLSTETARKAAPDASAGASPLTEAAREVAPDTVARVVVAPPSPPAARQESDAMALEARTAERERQARVRAPADSQDAAQPIRERVRAADVVAQAPSAPSAPASTAPEKATVEKSAAASVGSAAKVESARGIVERDESAPMPKAPANAVGQPPPVRESALPAAPPPSARPAAKLAAAPPASAPAGAVAPQVTAEEQRPVAAQVETRRRPFEASRASPSREDAARDLDAEKWLAHIERLRREGRHAEAKASLEDFRKHHPGHPVPKHLE